MTRPATDDQIAGWRDATLAPSAEPRWSDFVVGQLIARIDEYHDKVLRVLHERDHYRFEADQKRFVRQELEELIGTNDIGMAVTLIKEWKAAYERQQQAAVS